MSAVQVITVSLEELRQVLREELERLGVATAHPAAAAKELLSLRQAAKRLGVDRGTTLAELVRAGVVHTVPAGSRQKIPRAEIERLLSSGFERPAKARRPVRRRPQEQPAANDPADVRALEPRKL